MTEHILAVDVQYHNATATAAGLVFQDWQCDATQQEIRGHIEQIEDYEPGQFYRRELPCLQEVIRQLKCPVDNIIVDGYVWIGRSQELGLGGHLYEYLNKEVAVIGVAKTSFRSTPSIEVFRGSSRQPLFITSAGIPESVAADCIRSMHGEFRIPTLLKRVDQIARGTISPET